MKTLVITSRNQAGLACGYAAWNKLRLSAEYLSLDYGQDLPDLSDVEKLYVLGYTLTKEQIDSLRSRDIETVIIDDKNNIFYIKLFDEQLGIKVQKEEIDVVVSNDFENENTKQIRYLINSNKSSIRSCWEYFNPGYDLPKVFKYIEDRHLWKFKYTESRNLYYGLISQSVNNNYYWWHTLCISENLLNFILQKGNTISEYMDVTNREFVLNENNFNYRYLNNNKVAIFTYTTDVSELSKDIFNFKEDVNMIIGIKALSEDRTKLELRSRSGLRSVENNVDVGELARRFGGGGKTNSAGIILDSIGLQDFFEIFQE